MCPLGSYFAPYAPLLAATLTCGPMNRSRRPNPSGLFARQAKPSTFVPLIELQYGSGAGSSSARPDNWTTSSPRGWESMGPVRGASECYAPQLCAARTCGQRVSRCTPMPGCLLPRQDEATGACARELHQAGAAASDGRGNSS